ncbi:MAG: hypothetical protein AAF723_06080, partial [Pseudomonadota bacterium]
MNKTTPYLLSNMSLGPKLFLTSLTAAIVASLTAALVKPLGVSAHMGLSFGVGFLAALPFAYLFDLFFRRRPHTPILAQYFGIVSVCLPAILLYSFIFALKTYGVRDILYKNWVFNWPNYLAQDVLLILPAFAVATAVFVGLGKAPLKKPTERDETQDLNQSLQSDWLKNFWIEPLVHANIGVLASVLLGTGTLANRLALWLALFFILTSMIQLALWSFLRAKGWGYNMWWQIALISLPYLHWARLP